MTRKKQAPTKKKRKIIKKTSARYIKGLERDLDAVKLRIGGMGQAEIAQVLGWKTASAAHKAISRTLALAVEPPTAELRAIELARIDAMWSRLWEDFEARGPRLDRLKIADSLLKISERRGKLIALDAPVRIEHSGELTVKADRQRAEGMTTADLMSVLLEYAHSDPSVAKLVRKTLHDIVPEQAKPEDGNANQGQIQAPE